VVGAGCSDGTGACLVDGAEAVGGVATGGAEGVASVGVGGAAGCSDGTGAALADGAGAVGTGAVAAGGEGALGAGGGAGCSDGIAAGLPDDTPAVGAGGVDVGIGVVNAAVGAMDTPVAGRTDGSGTTDCRPLMKRESSRLATSSRPTDRTTTDRATQLNVILTG
jgi:hypothetical protein